MDAKNELKAILEFYLNGILESDNNDDIYNICEAIIDELQWLQRYAQQ